MVREVENYPESVSGNASAPKANQFFRLVTSSFSEIGWLLL